MLRLLVPVDDSQSSMRALEHLLRTLNVYKEPVEIHLLNAQYALSGDISMFVDRAQIEKYHQEQGEQALAAARAKLDAAGIRYLFHIGVGEPAHVITQYAQDKQCHQIVMGSRGLGSIASVILGSVAVKVLHLAEVPILFVK